MANSRMRKKTTNKARPEQNHQSPTKQRVSDGFSNPLARLGAGTPNLLESTEYTVSHITNNVQLLNSLYREHWLIKKIVNTIPQDMVKNWYKIESQLSPSNLQKFAKLERTTKLRAKILEGLQWGRLYGGAAGLIIIEGHEDLLSEPLEIDMVMPDSFKGLLIFDRYSGIVPTVELITNICDPDFGLPKYYIIQSDAIGFGIKVHHSRIVRFIGRELPYIDKLSEMYWGTSELEHILEELKKRDNASWNIAMLVFSANLKVYKMESGSELALMDETAQQDLYKTLSAMNWMMSSQGMQIIGEKDSFETHQFSFGGLSEIYEMFMLDVAGASEIPITKLFGRSPAGMNATGESDTQNYYDHIEEEQESDLRPVIDKLLPIMCMSTIGAIPDDLDYSFVPCRRPTEEERKNLASQVGNAVTEIFNAGIISQKMALKELRQSSEMTGMWSSITDADVERADDSFGATGEDMPSMFGDSYGLDYECGIHDAEGECRAKDPSKCRVHGSGGGKKKEDPQEQLRELAKKMRIESGETTEEKELLNERKEKEEAEEASEKNDRKQSNVTNSQQNVNKASKFTKEEYNNKIVGIKVEKGVVVTGMSNHAFERAYERDYDPAQVKDILLNYNNSYPDAIYSNRTGYQKGRNKVVVSDDGNIISIIILG